MEDEFSGLGRQIRKLSSRAALDFDTTTTMNRCKTETTKQVPKCILDDMSTLKDDVYVAGGH